MAQFKLINKDEVPEDLKPGKYCTKVISVEYVEGQLLVTLKYTSEIYNKDNHSCLFPLIKHTIED